LEKEIYMTIPTNPVADAKARYIMVGGFLGAGKTTAIIKLAAYLKGLNKRVGLITNDQSMDLVDTARVRAAGFAVEEITGGCFCCKFDSRVEASRELTRQTAPEVLIAEPVGSCTDLKATVSYPLRKLYGEQFHVAPLSVLVDPKRCARVLGLETSGGHFSEKVVYVYRKQLEEAEILVVNKIDMLERAAREKLVGGLKREFPQARVLEVSCATGEGLQGWFDLIASQELGRGESMDVDYDTYAEGEALLGWLNASVRLTASAEFDGSAFLMNLATDLRDRLASRRIEIAHLKMTLVPSEGPDMGSVSLTQTNGEPAATHSLASPLERGSLIINLRAETDPDVLKAMVNDAVAELRDVKGEVTVLASFRPGRPTPTHRMAGAAS
jgi:G3E family GTPase